jgi:nicotinamide-nucleotide amidase
VPEHPQGIHHTNTPEDGESRLAAHERRPLPASMELKDLMLAEPALTLAVAESLTCGRVQARVGMIPGASTFFLGGITAYTIEQKVRHLGVPEAEALATNGVSCEVAEAMAIGACNLFGARVGVATTGYAEVDPERKISTPFAWWALAHDLGDGRMAVQSGMVEMPNADRLRAQEIAAISALNHVIRYMRSVRGA